MSRRKHDHRSLEELRWRDEILGAVYWMAGEGIADAVDGAQLARFLASDPRVVGRRLARLAGDGYLERLDGAPRRYHLAEPGRREGRRSFEDAFADMSGPAHGVCGPACTCGGTHPPGQPCPGRPPPTAADEGKRYAA